MFPGFLHAQNPSEERIWTGKNGASFRGTYSRSLEQGGKIEFLMSSGKVAVVAFGNLSEKDQKVIREFETGGGTKKAIDDPHAFKELPIADRRLIPERKAKDFGGTDNESMVDALWVSMLWWNASGVVPIPKKGKFEKQAEWLHKELTRSIAKGGKSSTSLSDAKEGMEAYFKKRLDDIGTCRVTVIEEGLNPASLAKLTEGNAIVILKMSMTYSNGRSFTNCASVEKVNADGTFAMHLFGNRFTGKMTLKKDSQETQEKKKEYELVLNDRLEIPEFYRDQGAQFFLNANDWNGVLLLEPFIYKTPGEPAPIPK